MENLLDITPLLKRKDELTEELKKVGDLINLVYQYSKPKQPIIQIEKSPVSKIETEFHRNNEKSKKRGFTPGLRKAIVMHLSTGPATTLVLANTLNWKLADTRQVLATAFDAKVVDFNETTKYWTLTELGHKQAVWFNENPDRLTYSPKTQKRHFE